MPASVRAFPLSERSEDAKFPEGNSLGGGQRSAYVPPRRLVQQPSNDDLTPAVLLGSGTGFVVPHHLADVLLVVCDWYSQTVLRRIPGRGYFRACVLRRDRASRCRHARAASGRLSV